MTKTIANRGSLDDLQVFHQLARSLTSSLDLDSIFQIILRSMDRFINAELWAVLILDRERQELYYASPAGRERDDLADRRIKVGEGLAGWVALHGETLIIPEASTDIRISGLTQGKTFSVRSAIGLPIRGRKGTHGVIEIFNPHFDEDSDYAIAFLHILADYAAIAIENAEDVAFAQRLTITDDVTGLFNTRHLYTVLARELESCREASKPLSLVFLDLDRFKRINDAHGHLIGSELLGVVGKRIRELCRARDFCFRYGGDEFVVLMPSTTREEALRMARSIHATLGREAFKMANGLSLTIDASVGVSTYPGDGRSVHAILGAADRRMYAVKSSGRGRVEA